AATSQKDQRAEERSHFPGHGPAKCSKRRETGGHGTGQGGNDTPKAPSRARLGGGHPYPERLFPPIFPLFLTLPSKFRWRSNAAAYTRRCRSVRAWLPRFLLVWPPSASLPPATTVA